MRSSQELESSLAEVVEEQAHAAHPEFYQGCAASLEWVTGQRRNGPTSVDTRMAADAVTMRAELRLSIDMLHGEVPSGPLPRAYLSGVEATLSWVLGQSDEAPL